MNSFKQVSICICQVQSYDPAKLGFLLFPNSWFEDRFSIINLASSKTRSTTNKHCHIILVGSVASFMDLSVDPLIFAISTDMRTNWTSIWIFHGVFKIYLSLLKDLRIWGMICIQMLLNAVHLSPRKVNPLCWFTMTVRGWFSVPFWWLFPWPAASSLSDEN